jgi:prepilin-type N-terminal cleavage/methylation domain-containing protein
MKLIIKKSFCRRKAYTLVEILVVITIITILATIIIISIVNAQAKSRDSKRRADVRTIANALQAYHLDTKSWLVQGLLAPVGTGHISSGASTGTGWFNRTGNGTDYSIKSIATALVERKFLIEELKDPKMTNNNDITDNFQYVVSECPSGTITTPFNRNGLAVYAKLEHPNQQDNDGITEEQNRGSAACNIPAEMDFIVTVH